MAPGGDGEAAIEPEAASSPFEISGSIATSYRRRSRGSDHDNDLYGYLRLGGARADGSGPSFHFYGRGTLDLDDDAGDSGSRFRSLNDLGGEALDAHVYEAWVELPTDALGLESVRIGRQTVHAAYTYLVDGARLRFAEIDGLARLRPSLFGGVPEYLYDSSRSGDWIVGLDLPFRPAERTRVELRYVHSEEGDTATGGSETDDFTSVALFQGLGPDAQLSAEWNTIDGSTRDVAARLHWDFPEPELSLHAKWAYQSSITKEFTTVYDSLVGVLGESYAFHDISLEATKLLGEHFAVNAGAALRELVDDDREGPFNREYRRAWVSVSSRRWLREDLELSLTGEVWETDDDRERSIGAEARWFPTEELRITGGTYYSLYKYDLFEVREREDVTTWFLKARYRTDGGLQLDGRCELEHGGEGDTLSLLAGLTWRF